MALKKKEINTERNMSASHQNRMGGVTGRHMQRSGRERIMTNPPSVRCPSCERCSTKWRPPRKIEKSAGSNVAIFEDGCLHLINGSWRSGNATPESASNAALAGLLSTYLYGLDITQKTPTKTEEKTATNHMYDLEEMRAARKLAAP